MPYTIWTRSQLLGGSELDYSRVLPRQRSGDFLPTAIGETLIPASSVDANGSLEPREPSLELRGPDGSVIPTEWIEIRDTAYSGSFVEPEAPSPDELDLEILEDELDGAWEGEFPRFEIDVKLVDDGAIP